MVKGSSDRIPSSSLILAASIAFTVISYAIFRGLWGVDIRPLWLAAVLALQLSMMLLAGSKVLTRLGAASLSALTAIAATLAAVYFLFPLSPAVRVAGAVGGGAALLFVLASFVAASRSDPVPPPAGQPLDLGLVETDEEARIIKYGEAGFEEGAEEGSAPAPQLKPREGSAQPSAGNEADPEDRVYEFDVLSESDLEAALGNRPPTDPPEPLDLEEVNIVELLAEMTGNGQATVPAPGPEAVAGAQTGADREEQDWVEDTARSMAYSDPQPPLPRGEADTGLEGKLSAASGHAGFTMRTRYRVLDAGSGEHLGTYYGDEGYSTLDPVSLGAMLSSKLPPGEVRIVKLDWSNFDEIEVHLEVSEEASPATEPVPDPSREESGRREGETYGPAAPVTPAEEKDGVRPRATGKSRYVIYDRRTIQPMGEFVPDGKRPRIDRLTLYRMYPQYDFRTFEIDSIRWEGDEVRVYIRGEKKDRPGTTVHRHSGTASGSRQRSTSGGGQDGSRAGQKETPSRQARAGPEDPEGQQ